jgi:prevent-host-death family protein
VDEISISEFKTKFDKTIKRAQKTKRPFRITRRGKPVADLLVLMATPVVDRAKLIGSMKGSIKILGDTVSPTIGKPFTIESLSPAAQ